MLEHIEIEINKRAWECSISTIGQNSAVLSVESLNNELIITAIQSYDPNENTRKYYDLKVFQKGVHIPENLDLSEYDFLGSAKLQDTNGREYLNHVYCKEVIE